MFEEQVEAGLYGLSEEVLKELIHELASYLVGTIHSEFCSHGVDNPASCEREVLAIVRGEDKPF